MKTMSVKTLGWMLKLSEENCWKKDVAIFNAEELENFCIQIIPFQIEATLNGSDVQMFALI